MFREGEKVQLDVHPDNVDTVAIDMGDGSTVYAVLALGEQEKLVKLQLLTKLSASVA